MIQTVENLLPNGWNQFEIKRRATEFKCGLTVLNSAILVTANLSVRVSLRFVSNSVQAIESISVK